ncbi:unnamed protein product, partial [Aphis gossypii]
TIQKPNKNQPYLPINDLLKCILDVSQNNTFQLYMGEVYYKILEQSILSRSYYWHSLSSHWNDLFSLTYNLYNVDFANMRHVSIKIMKHIVVRGDAHSSVSLAIKKKIFSYLKQAILDTLKENNDFSLREDLIILVFDVCKTLWIECRKSLCQFIEENCTHLINFYENDKPKKIQEKLYNLLTLFIKIHHPKCIDFNHKESYVYNENMWIDKLYHIYEFVRREILQIKNNSNPNFFNYISELAVTIFNIVYFNKLDSSILVLDECPTPKRKKYDINVLSFVNGLTDLKTSEICTRLNIITKLLENHALPFHEKDYIHLLESLTICLNSYKDTKSIKYLIICCNELIKSENIYKLNQFGPFLKTVWSYALKMVMSNEDSDLSHSLLHSLIVLINWHNEMYSDILRLYFSKTIKINDPSLKTLVVLFKTRGFCSASLNETNMILLLDWLLPLKLQDALLVESFSKLNPYLLSEVVDLILTKPSIKKSFDNHNNLKTISFIDFTNTCYDLALQDRPNVQLHITDLSQNKSIRRSIDENTFEILINFIEKSIALQEKPSIATLQMFLSMTNFLCFLENQFPQFINDFSEFRLYKFKYMEKVNNIVSELNTHENQHNNEAFVNVCSLFHKRLQFVDDIIVNELMNHNTNKVIMAKLYNLSKYNGQTGYQTHLLETLIDDLKELEGSISQSYTYFKVTNFLHIALSLNNLTIDMIVQFNKFIKQIAKAWCSHQEGFIKITQLLSDALQITTKNNLNKVCTTNLLMLIWSLQKISTTKNCGPKMICAFIDLLGNFASIQNGSFGSTWNINTNVIQPMSPKIILYYLDNPFLQYDISEEEREDECTNRISTYLLCVQSLITSSVKYQKEGLFEIFQTIRNQQINLDLVINMLECVKIELKMKSYMELLENNLKFFTMEMAFKEFPIRLFSCTTMEQFFKKYRFEIIPILVIKNDLNFLNSMNILHKLIEIVEVPFINHDEIKKVIVNELGEIYFNELIKLQCTDIILQFIQMVVINTEQPIVPIQISSDQFLVLINIFQEIYVKNNNPFLTHMSMKKPNYIQTIVHVLYQSFFQYTVFMKALIGQLLDYNQIDEFSHFLINQSILSTITLLNQNNIERHNYVIEYLEWLLMNPKSILKLNTSQIGPLISTLRSLAKKLPSSNEKLLNLLNILKNFSDQNIFCETNKENETALYKDINYFLYQQNENIDIIKSLQCLKLKLQTNEIELQNMYRELLKIRGFSEDCIKSILHCLICTLIKLTKSDEFEIKILAASCLGILGPSDLTTLILQPEPEVLKLEPYISPEYLFMKHIVELVLNYLSDDNISVLEAKKLGPKVVYPFKPSEQKELDVELSFDIEQFNLLIDKNEIWCPIDSSISYSSWITNITKHLLETLQGFCKSLLPIAENKPLFCENILPHLVYFLLEYKSLTRPILNKHLNRKMNKDKESMVFNPVDVITEMLPKEGLLLQTILHESYKSIGDSDAIEGCGSSYLLNLSSRTQYYQQLRKWDRVMENCDLQQTTELISKDYLEAFSNSGLQNVAHIMASNDNLKYDYCWQLNKWDLPDSGDKSFESLHYHALRYVHLNNLERAIPIINEARIVIIESLYCASLESTATIYAPLAKLKIIEDLDDFISTTDKKKLFNIWLNQNTLKTNDFININKILSQRCKLLDFDGDKRSGILRIKIAELAQQNDWLQVAGKHLATVATLENYQKHTTLWAKVEEARLLWKRNDCYMARVLLKCVVEELDNYDYPFLHSLALQLYGSWMEETKSETSCDIIRKYFQKSIKKLELEPANKEEFGLDWKKVLSDAHKHLSLFTDTLYQQLNKYIKTEDFQKRIHEVEHNEIEGRTMVESGKSSKNQEEIKAGIYLINQSRNDKIDISNKNEEKNKYLKLTLQNYLQLMRLDDESRLPIYRIVSLWLENKENNEINDIVDQEFEKNPSYKFILVLPQLVAHLSSTHNYSFHKSLEKIINRCAIDHPYQTIPIVYAVANTNIDQKFIQCESPFNDEEESRVLAAKHLMSNWKRNINISSIVKNTEKLYEAFIQLAYTKVSCSRGQRISMSDKQPLMKITNSELYMYPAATLPLNKHGDYKNIISIVKFENSFLNAGGIHEPKKIDCWCSDGILRSLLLKGNEDMHQDAIMQQVFVLMNRLLNSNKSTAKRKLAIRTYKVIPFSKQSGIAEWCVNTMSVINYLIGTDTIEGAHQKYRPEDMAPETARDILRSSQARRDNELVKQKKYMEICKALKPVFRYYFFEKFLSPSIWFERRQAFIHSVATTSMIGYILGLGDRHFHNILIDNNTAELIHIDFGVAFEQGTLLNTPETVPFRLTRDIVDGMGICGIEGNFRKCCEKTMSVLRQNQDVIVTITEVLLYDPCYQWALTGKKAAQLQNESTKNSYINEITEVNKLAERSLNRVRDKLCGMEQAETAAASINGQVNLLIQKARDPNNLALIFHGWQAYL